MRVMSVQARTILPSLAKNAKISLPKGAVVSEKAIAATAAAISTAGVVYGSGGGCSDYDSGEPSWCVTLCNF